MLESERNKNKELTSDIEKKNQEVEEYRGYKLALTKLCVERFSLIEAGPTWGRVKQLYITTDNFKPTEGLSVNFLKTVLFEALTTFHKDKSLTLILKDLQIDTNWFFCTGLSSAEKDLLNNLSEIVFWNCFTKTDPTKTESVTFAFGVMLSQNLSITIVIDNSADRIAYSGGQDTASSWTENNYKKS
ncbi:MAG: hypothetical protein K2X98_05605 [Alphaproteobacteria bacterium]|nr:hypothetical protein [Alphaproteobacteria bacterium]